MAEKKYQVPALMRAKKILDLLSKDEADLQELVNKTGFPKSSTYNLLQTMEDIGFVRRLNNGSKFALGFRLYELGNLAVAKVSIRDQAIVHLRALSEGEKITCHMGTLDGLEAVYLHKVDPQDSILINSWEGRRLSLNRSAMGKVLLAWLTEEQRTTIIDALSFEEERTPYTITDKGSFLEEVRKVRKRFWAMDDQEDVLGIRCLAAPIFSPNGAVKYSLSVSSMVQNMPQERIGPLCQRLMKTAGEISSALGTPRKIWSQMLEEHE